MRSRHAWFGPWLRLAVAAVCVVAVACDDGHPGAHGSADTAAGGDAGAVQDGADASDTQAAPWTPPAVAGPDQGADLTPGKWVLAAVVSGSDQIGPALEQGTFELPGPGQKAYGTTWTSASIKDGSLPAKGGGTQYQYAAIALETPQALGVILRLDRAFDVWLGGQRLPGDIYGSGQLRFAGQLQEGTTLLVVRGRGGQGLGVSLRTTTHRAVLNALDLTRPDLRVGDASSRWLGVPLLVPGAPAAAAVQRVTARVVGDSRFKATATELAGVAGGMVTQLAFAVELAAPPTAAGENWTIHLQVDSPGWPESYALAVELPTVAVDAAFRQTFRSPDDGSVQYYGVRPPVQQGPNQPLLLSLHGAGVDAIGQAGAYHAHPKIYIAAPTNRRPFGFDWEEWGHANALFALDDAMARFGTDPHRVYLGGHSMGGHGTWTVGTHHSDRFRVLGPSAGWGSFYTYQGSKKPTGPVGRARAHSDTHVYMGNLAQNAVYVIHGTADDNVPYKEGLAMFNAVSQISSDVGHHWEQGAGHWWDGDASPGADCVDWPELFSWFDSRQLQIPRLDFSWRSPGPYYNPQHEWLRVASAVSPMDDVTITSAADGKGTVILTTQNVRSLLVDGAVLAKAGIATLRVDGKDQPVEAKSMAIGPQDGKRPGVYGPFNAVHQKPWAWVFPDGDEALAGVAAYFASTWAAIGNGQAAVLPRSKVTPAVRQQLQLVWLGVPAAQLDLPKGFALKWGDGDVTVGGNAVGDVAVQTVFDAGDKLGAALWAPADRAWLLYWLVPFSSRSGMPDYFTWDESGGKVSGFFDATWKFDPAFAKGL
ncbi:MAG: prolyl oligopeptidase family serine peptidase [Deltaproteobacteria bacterium]|nr:prolyl oligopeptidase family serine peptidase [Deltaproteobacteria bacterium]